jgi:hypothetical protein
MSQNPGCAASSGARSGEALYNAAQEYDAAGMPDDARRARETLVRTFGRQRRNPLVELARQQLAQQADTVRQQRPTPH